MTNLDSIWWTCRTFVCLCFRGVVENEIVEEQWWGCHKGGTDPSKYILRKLSKSMLRGRRVQAVPWVSCCVLLPVSHPPIFHQQMGRKKKDEKGKKKAERILHASPQWAQHNCRSTLGICTFANPLTTNSWKWLLIKVWSCACGNRENWMTVESKLKFWSVSIPLLTFLFVTEHMDHSSSEVTACVKRDHNSTLENDVSLV